MLRRVAIALVLWAGAWALAPDARAQNAGGGDRIALVIGNDRYPNLPSDKQLAKAANDARAIGETLRKLGYRVISGENLTRQEMVDKLFAFTSAIKPGDTAALFFAGHGVAIAGGNYLLPTDVRPAAPGEEARVRNMALGEADIIADIQERKARVAVLFIDACRDNPFRQPGVLRSTGGERGLARSGEAEGVFAIYSAGYGQSALDTLGPGDTSPNSVFTRVLAPALARNDAHLGELIIDVREQVSKLARSVGHQQLPAYYDQTLGGRVYLAGLPVAVVASRVNDAVVTLASSQTAEEAAKNPDGKPKRSNGAGFVVDPSGLILTTDYLVDLTSVEVGFTDKSRRNATVIAVDKASGLALIKVTPAKPLTALKFGDSETLKVGTQVFAIGNRGNLGNTVTAGLVSGLNREANKASKQKYIETDIAYKGMGGGPLLNLDGEVVGINFAMTEAGASGYAVSSKVAAAVLDQLRASEPPRPWLGVRVTKVTDDIAENLALNPARGALVSSVDDRGPAKPAGLASSDVILNVDGKDIKEMPDLLRVVAQSQIGKTVSVVVWRNGKEEKLTASLGQIRLAENAPARPQPAAPAQQAAQPQTPGDGPLDQLFQEFFKGSKLEEARSAAASVRQAFGLRVADLDDGFRSRHKVDAGVNGLGVTEVDSGSPAADKQVKPGEVIVDVQQEKTSTVIDFSKRVERLKQDGRKTVLLLVAGADGNMRFVVMPVR